MYCNRSYVDVHPLSLSPVSFIFFQSKPIPEPLQPSLTCGKWPGVARFRDPLLKFSRRFDAINWNTSSVHALHHKLGAFSILTRHRPHTETATLAFEVQQQKLARILFSSLTISWIEDLFLPQTLATSAYNIFLSLLSQELSIFHLKEALYGFSLACPNCQHHYSCTLAALLSKIRTIWTQAPRCTSAKQTTNMAMKKRVIQQGYAGQRMIHAWAGGRGMALDFITLLRRVCNLKLMNCVFLEFST